MKILFYIEANLFISCFALLLLFSSCSNKINNSGNNKELRFQELLDSINIDNSPEKQKEYLIEVIELTRSNDISDFQNRNEIWLYCTIIFFMTSIIYFYFFQKQRLKYLNKTVEIKLESLRAQMNPHFISNSINAIESLVNQGRNDEASEYLIDFSRLCRRVLDHSKDPNVSLREELDTLKCFLSLEELRLSEDFKYTISIDHQINPESIIVPAMIFQPFVENAIWHGIKNKEEPRRGIVKIEINKISEKQIECIIEDNGVGRVRAIEIQKTSVLRNKSWGTTITEQRISSLKELKNADLKIIDLYDENQEPKGTKVILSLPIIQKQV